jgi:hypothetical protein
VIVEEHPLSLRIAVSESANFTCKARCERKCSNVYWVINGIEAHYEDEDSRASFMQMGFTFFYYKEQNIYNAILTVNATKAENNTNVYCVFEDGNGSNHSLSATLLIITGTCFTYSILFK